MKMTSEEGDVKWQDTSLKDIIIFDVCIFGSAMFVSLILFFFASYFAKPIGQFIDWLIILAIDLIDVVGSTVGAGILILYLAALILAITYGFYALFNYGIIRLLKLNNIPQFRTDCKVREFCYQQSKWNQRVNKVLIGVGILIGIVMAFLTPGLLSPPVELSGLAGFVWIFFIIISFGLPIYRLFAILSDVSFFAYRDPTFKMRKRMYLVFIVILSIWNAFLITFIFYINISYDFQYALYLSYILLYIIEIASFIPFITFLVQFIRIRKK